MKAILLVGVCLSFSSCISLDQKKRLEAEAFLQALESNQLEVISLPLQSSPDLALPPESGLEFLGVFSIQDFKFAIHDYEQSIRKASDLNSSKFLHQNANLVLMSLASPPVEVAKIFNSLRPPLTIYDAGIFIYPLGLCLFLSVFVIVERFVSLRRGVTFPRKVEKALRVGEFPNKKWKQGSAAERIVWVAVHEKPSHDSLKSYSALESSALQRGLFVLEFVIAGAPLIGLLGTVTGLVQVFSSMPSMTEGKDALTEGIGLALLTTILGLAIAIPTLIGHSYLSRLVERRVASLNWVTSRINDAINPSAHSKELF